MKSTTTAFGVAAAVALGAVAVGLSSKSTEKPEPPATVRKMCAEQPTDGGTCLCGNGNRRPREFGRHSRCLARFASGQCSFSECPGDP